MNLKKFVRILTNNFIDYGLGLKPKREIPMYVTSEEDNTINKSDSLHGHR